MIRPFVRRPPVALVTLALVALLALAPAPAAAQDAATSCDGIPWNVRVDGKLQPIVVSLLQQSGTFRAQCRVVAATRRVRVVVTSSRELDGAVPARARAQITRYSYGLLRVVIELPPLADVAELLPHEFEHVLEQIEGVDLAARAAMRDGQVFRLLDGIYETARAKAAGRAAAREVYGDTDPAVRATVRGLRGAFRSIAGSAGPAGAIGAPSRR